MARSCRRRGLGPLCWHICLPRLRIASCRLVALSVPVRQIALLQTFLLSEVACVEAADCFLQIPLISTSQMSKLDCLWQSPLLSGVPASKEDPLKHSCRPEWPSSGRLVGPLARDRPLAAPAWVVLGAAGPRPERMSSCLRWGRADGALPAIGIRGRQRRAPGDGCEGAQPRVSRSRCGACRCRLGTGARQVTHNHALQGQRPNRDTASRVRPPST